MRLAKIKCSNLLKRLKHVIWFERRSPLKNLSHVRVILHLIKVKIILMSTKNGKYGCNLWCYLRGAKLEGLLKVSRERKKLGSGKLCFIHRRP